MYVQLCNRVLPNTFLCKARFVPSISAFYVAYLKLPPPLLPLSVIFLLSISNIFTLNTDKQASLMCALPLDAWN